MWRLRCSLWFPTCYAIVGKYQYFFCKQLSGVQTQSNQVQRLLIFCLLVSILRSLSHSIWVCSFWPLIFCASCFLLTKKVDTEIKESRYKVDLLTANPMPVWMSDWIPSILSHSNLSLNRNIVSTVLLLLCETENPLMRLKKMKF